MITISEIISRNITQTPFLEEGIAEGLINLSALARTYKPQIERELLKPVSESAILMALKRMVPEIQAKSISHSNPENAATDITVRSGLSEFTFLKSDTILENQLILLHELKDRRDYFITFTQGMNEITTILSTDLEEKVQEAFSKEKLVKHLKKLAAITIRLNEQIIYTPGVHYNILKQLAWHKINIIEVVSTYTEFNIILHKNEVDISFSVLMKYFHSD